jgi:glycosyltransferase involved in cell wall biosynthesis
MCGRSAPDHDLLRAYSKYNISIKLGLSHREVVSELHSSDLFVFPSLLEGFGHVVLEAMASGLPVLTTPHTCGPDVISEGTHGFIVPIRDPQAIAEKIAWGLEHRESLLEMGRAAAPRAREFTWERFRKQMLKEYIGIVETQGAFRLTPPRSVPTFRDSL